MIKKEDVLKRLKRVIDPELNINIVDLGFVRDVLIDQKTKSVKVKITLTSPICPFSSFFEEMIAQELKKIKEIKNVKIDFGF